MENTLKNKEQFESSKDPQIKADSWNKSQSVNEVFFIINVKELFNVDLNYPGVMHALNHAFSVSKAYVPVDTGLTKKSYSLQKLDNVRIKAFFDPSKIIGQKRNGKVVKEYYVQYIAEHASRFNWLSIVMKHFYDALYNGMRRLMKKSVPDKNIINPDKISLVGAGLFMQQLNAEYKAKKEEYKRLRDEAKEKQKLKLERIKEQKRLNRIKNQALDKLKEE